MHPIENPRHGLMTITIPAKLNLADAIEVIRDALKNDRKMSLSEFPTHKKVGPDTVFVCPIKNEEVQGQDPNEKNNSIQIGIRHPDTSPNPSKPAMHLTNSIVEKINDALKDYGFKNE